jgi:hypothetical protein
MKEAVEHYKCHELIDCGKDGKAYSTRNRKTLVLDKWVVQHWGALELRAIITVAVEQCLKTLVTTQFGDPKPLAGGTREKIRGAMSSVFNHAIRWEFTDRNPIAGPPRGAGVRVSGKRERTPDILDVEEMQKLLAALGVRESRSAPRISRRRRARSNGSRVIVRRRFMLTEENRSSKVCAILE